MKKLMLSLIAAAMTLGMPAVANEAHHPDQGKPAAVQLRRRFIRTRGVPGRHLEGRHLDDGDDGHNAPADRTAARHDRSEGTTGAPARAHAGHARHDARDARHGRRQERRRNDARAGHARATIIEQSKYDANIRRRAGGSRSDLAATGDRPRARQQSNDNGMRLWHAIPSVACTLTSMRLRAARSMKDVCISSAANAAFSPSKRALHTTSTPLPIF